MPEMGIGKFPNVKTDQLYLDRENLDILLERVAANTLGLAVGDYFALDRLYIDRTNRDSYLYRHSATHAALSGGLKLADTLDMTSKKITSLLDPTAAQDADTKTARDAAITTHAADGDAHAQGGHVVLFAVYYNSIGQGTWTPTVLSTTRFQTYLLSASAADGDNVSWKAYLPKGTWTLRLSYVRNTDKGIADIDIDDTEVVSLDCYGVADADAELSQTSISIATSGLKTIKLRVDGKHASSSGYAMGVAAIALWRTA